MAFVTDQLMILIMRNGSLLIATEISPFQLIKSRKMILLMLTEEEG